MPKCFWRCFLNSVWFKFLASRGISLYCLLVFIKNDRLYAVVFGRASVWFPAFLKILFVSCSLVRGINSVMYSGMFVFLWLSV